MVKFIIDRIKLNHKINGAWKETRAMLAEMILEDCNYYCKRAEGDLIGSSLIHSRPRKGKLIWQTPYAKRQYWEIETAYPDANPNATWKWCEVAKQNHKEKWELQAQALYVQKLAKNGVGLYDVGGNDE